MDTRGFNRGFIRILANVHAGVLLLVVILFFVVVIVIIFFVLFLLLVGGSAAAATGNGCLYGRRARYNGR